MPYLATSGRLDEAAALLASATDPKNKPQSPELWAIQAEVLRRLSEPAKALEALDRGTKAVGEHALFRIARAEVLNSQGRDKDAYATLEEGVGLVPPEQRLMISSFRFGTCEIRLCFASFPIVSERGRQPNTGTKASASQTLKI